ncbi:cytochrome aa3 quinol oxidase subunit IV [Bacillus thermotolerans]|uniref:Quinol oxidase subunit 4 n=1 Tax=Bacillus thermotolerans TaxID=1221996 RepID=A0A0F5HJR7_BACTR|nr:cytochrome aa3 quinol oxidase subunit IV [Bacillus thermotolerans]KKB33629.1 AA3-600 quinol oxidase subunit IV [Bacillus thermotolerans]KKB41779.1 AA3-600 quinol oxidase subunit IV [Bacillus thermotolerans]KKB44328.1 AA3-600 quinol oxidase subunit IV [Bacillus thermotolerans]
MGELFPRGQVMGFIFSLVLTAVAMLVYFMDMSFTTGMTVLLVTAFIQAGLQLVVFMHAGETKDKYDIYANIVYGVLMALAVVFGTLLLMIWDVV